MKNLIGTLNNVAETLKARKATALMSELNAITASLTLTADSGLTSPDLAKRINDALPEFNNWSFGAREDKRHLGGRDSVWVYFYSVPKDASDLDRLNAKVSIRLTIVEASKTEPWLINQPAPAKISAELVTSYHAPKFVKKTGSPDRVIQYVIDWFKKNQTELLVKAE